MAAFLYPEYADRMSSRRDAINDIRRLPVAATVPVSADPALWQQIYLLLIAAMGVLMVWSFATTSSLSLPLRLIFLSLLVLTLKRWTGAAMLGLIQLHLLLIEPPSHDPTNVLGGFLWVALTVVLLMIVSRYRTLRQRDHASSVTAFGGPLSSSGSGGPPMAEAEATPPDQIWYNLNHLLQQCIRGVLLIAACAVLAVVVISLVPQESVSLTIREFGLKPSGYRLIRLALGLFAVWLVAWIIVNELVWRSLSPAQARMYVRGTMTQWLHRDLRMIIFKRMKVRQQKQKSMQPVKRNDPLDESDVATGLKD